MMFNLTAVTPEGTADLRKTHCYKLLKLCQGEPSPSEVHVGT